MILSNIKKSNNMIFFQKMNIYIFVYLSLFSCIHQNNISFTQASDNLTLSLKNNGNISSSNHQAIYRCSSKYPHINSIKCLSLVLLGILFFEFCFSFENFPLIPEYRKDTNDFKYIEFNKDSLNCFNFDKRTIKTLEKENGELYNNSKINKLIKNDFFYLNKLLSIKIPTI
ncbi:MAG: hypothetical protein GY830_09365 [Bacteroidetes bacterium]|nr:hypothetical protein [Bacteroidota bacterium]